MNRTALLESKFNGLAAKFVGEWVAIFWIGFSLRCFQRLSVAAWLPGTALSDDR